MTPMLRRSKSFSKTAGLWLRCFLSGALVGDRVKIDNFQEVVQTNAT
jgi:hypothetical protein